MANIDDEQIYAIGKAIRKTQKELIIYGLGFVNTSSDMLEAARTYFNNNPNKNVCSARQVDSSPTPSGTYYLWKDPSTTDNIIFYGKEGYGVGYWASSHWEYNFIRRNALSFANNEYSRSQSNADGPIIHEKDCGVVLWRNADPSADVSTLTVDLDLSSYAYVVIEFRESTSSTGATYFQTVKVGTSDNGLIGGKRTGTSQTRMFMRDVSVTTTQVSFGVAMTMYFINGSSNAVSTVANGAIPIAIYGTKIL